MPELEIKQTAGAQRAMGLAELVNKVFTSERVKSSAPAHAGYRLEMSGPDGPSTTELRKVEDRLELIPVDPKPGEARILVGTADPGMSQAELRAFDRLQRDGVEVAVDRADYERVLAKVEAFFDRQGVPVTIAQGTGVAKAPSAAPAASGKRVAAVIVGLVAFVLAAVVAMAMRHR